MRRGNAVFIRRLNDHLQYLERVTDTLKGESDFQGVSCTECKLGRWIDSDGRDIMEACVPDGARLFEALVEKHRQFHVISDEALARQAAGDYLNGYRAMTEMLRVSNELASLLLDADQWASQPLFVVTEFDH